MFFVLNLFNKKEKRIQQLDIIIDDDDLLKSFKVYSK
jgi:hypothetical protein